MKTPRFILAGSILATLLSSLLPLSLLAASKEEILVDFTDVRQERDGALVKLVKNYDYVWDAWDKHVTDMPRRGALIQAPINEGQLGEDNTDVKFADTPIVELVFVIGNANKASGIAFYLADSDGTEQEWSIPFEGLSPGRECHFQLDLNKCTKETAKGKKPGMNLKKIYSWRVKGDWSKSSVEVLLVKLVAAKKG